MAADAAACTFDVKKPIKLDVVHATSVFAYSRYPTDKQSEAILRMAEWIVANGIEGPGAYRAARDLLLRNTPRLIAGQSLRAEPNETIVETACRVGLSLAMVLRILLLVGLVWASNLDIRVSWSVAVRMVR